MSTRDYLIAVFILICILLFPFLMNTKVNNAGFLLTLFMGIYCIINYKSLGEKVNKYYILIPFPNSLRRWKLIYDQGFFLIFGIFFVVISVLKILSLFF